VHERSPEIREIGAGIYLMNNSCSIFDHYGIADLIFRPGVPLKATERLEHDGRLIQRHITRDIDRWIGVTRSDLVQGLAEAARREGAEIRTGSEGADVDPTGRLVLASGET